MRLRTSAFATILTLTLLFRSPSAYLAPARLSFFGRTGTAAAMSGVSGSSGKAASSSSDGSPSSSSSSSSSSSTTAFDVSSYPDLTPSLVSSIQENLSLVLSSIHQTSPAAILTPVSKTKPWSYLLPILHHPTTPLTSFAENYAQECSEKMLLVGKPGGLPKNTSFCFIGALQSNKINGLVAAGSGGRLERVETVSTAKAIRKFQSAITDKWTDGETLDVMLQIDTSREASKSGVDYEDTDAVKTLVRECAQCDRLRFVGLMTIGATGDETAFDKVS